ncbi:MAG: divalent metal cation transporter [Actinomycetota bacterium]|nr:divalent metal cation transporter [Actinomycetota bacterium]
MPGKASPAPDEAPETTAVLDEAHVGDIRGALGTISRHELPPRRPWRKRLLALAAIMGPGLIVMVGDNDAGGVATYAQAGQNYGPSLLWVLLLLMLVLMVSQEMVVRLGAVTGVGHGRLIKERFGRMWAAFSVGDLVILNFATLVTEFIGVSLALSYFGVSPFASVPLAAVALVVMTATGSFRRWERFMYLLVASNLLVYPLAFFSGPKPGSIARGLLVPGVAGGFNSTSVLLLIAIVGTTVAPWQLFFQQSNIVDKRITPRWINYERADTFLGAVITNLGAGAIMVTTAFAFAGTRFHGRFTNALAVAHDLSGTLGHAAGAMFAIVLLDASLLGAAAVTLSISYAVGDVFGAKHSLHRGWRDAKAFYGSFAALILAAAGIVLIPGAPLGLITEGVQALAGVLLPSAIVFLLMLCNDAQVLGPWVNPRWLNAVATTIVAVLVALSVILMATTLFPRLDVPLLTEVVGSVVVVALLVGAATSGRRRNAVPPVPAEEKARWTMPQLALLERPRWSPGRRAGLYLLRAYLVIAVVLLVVKTVEVGLGH